MDIDEFFNKLIEFEGLIIVEGKKDRRALIALGCSSEKIYSLKKPLYKVIDEVSEICKECIILTDLDKEGRKLFRVLQHKLKENGIKIDNKYREFLFKETKLRQIEGIESLMKH